jgi:hypothetical protein
MIAKVSLRQLSTFFKRPHYGFAFKQFDYQDGLNLKSLLTE